MVRLSSRLAAVAGLVTPGARVIDVGTDHGLVPVWLAQHQISPKIIATDLRPGPLRSARALVERTETDEQIELRVCDGLDGFGPADADTVLISGLGGENIVRIVERAPWVRENAVLVLQPQSKSEALRRWLLEHGFMMERELLTEDAGRLYAAFRARGGTPPRPYTEAELYTGLWEQLAAQPLFPQKLAGLIARLEKAAPYDQSAALTLRQAREMEERLFHGEDRGCGSASGGESAPGSEDGF